MTPIEFIIIVGVLGGFAVGWWGRGEHEKLKRRE